MTNDVTVKLEFSQVALRLRGMIKAEVSIWIFSVRPDNIPSTMNCLIDFTHECPSFFIVRCLEDTIESIVSGIDPIKEWEKSNSINNCLQTSSYINFNPTIRVS